METSPRVWIKALRDSHELLDGLAGTLTGDQIRALSYCQDWTVAQVLSHLGSGAEIAGLMLEGALGRSEPPGRDQLTPVWDRWNAKEPYQQAVDALSADAAYVAALEGLSDDELAAIRLSFIGSDFDAAGLVRLRLGEHALHTWDIEVVSDPAARLAPGAADLLIDHAAAFIAPRIGKSAEVAFTARITTTGPDRDYLLAAADKVTMTDWPGDGAPAPDLTVIMPAEALIRLAYGRLDPGHTPAGIAAGAADLDRLRAVFPGF